LTLSRQNRQPRGGQERGLKPHVQKKGDKTTPALIGHRRKNHMSTILGCAKKVIRKIKKKKSPEWMPKKGKNGFIKGGVLIGKKERIQRQATSAIKRSGGNAHPNRGKGKSLTSFTRRQKIEPVGV